MLCPFFNSKYSLATPPRGPAPPFLFCGWLMFVCCGSRLVFFLLFFRKQVEKKICSFIFGEEFFFSPSWGSFSVYFFFSFNCCLKKRTGSSSLIQLWRKIAIISCCTVCETFFDVKKLSRGGKKKIFFFGSFTKPGGRGF